MWKDVVADYFRVDSLLLINRMRRTDRRASATVLYLSIITMNYSLIILFSRMRWKEMIACLLVCLPMLYILASVYRHPVGLPKMMYLCPMDADRRRQYIRGSYHFRIFVNMTVAVIWTGILLLFYDCGRIAAAEILLNDLALSLLIPWEKKTDEKFGTMNKEAVCMCCVMVVSMLANFALVQTVTDKDAENVIVGIGFACIVLIQMPLTITYQKYVRGELEAAVSYEKSYGDPICR